MSEDSHKDYVPLDEGGALWMALGHRSGLPRVGAFGLMTIPDKQRVCLIFKPPLDGITWLTPRACREVAEQLTTSANLADSGLDAAPADVDAVRTYLSDMQFPSALLDMAWGIIANASGGNWKSEPVEWQDAAERWRADYFRYLDQRQPTP